MKRIALIIGGLLIYGISFSQVKEAPVAVPVPEPSPTPIAPYRQFTDAGNIIFISGQIAIDPKTNNIIKSDFRSEVDQVMKNLQSVIESAGVPFNNVLKCTVYLTDMKLFEEFNEIYRTYFEEGRWPARETVQVVALPKGARIEISAIVMR
jgi:2-iminobutanoate/2-iminopropanoate deaminase